MRTDVLTNGANGSAKNGASNGVRAKKNGASTHRPGTNGAATVPPAVKLAHVNKSFGKTAVLKEINLSVAAGELVEIVGPSGSGKTTLLRLVHGQLRPNAGQVWVHGRGLHRWWRRGLGRVRRDVAFVFQEHHLLPRLTAFENLTLALQVTDPQLPFKAIKRRALETLDSMGLAHKRNAYPRQLSAGERQRIAVGRALAARPRVILADEPMASIDDDNARIVMRLLEDAAAAGTAVIVASHRHTFPSSRVLRLPTGTILLNGSKKAASNGNGHANGNGRTPPRRRTERPCRSAALAPAAPEQSAPAQALTQRPSRLPLWRRLVARRQQLPAGGLERPAKLEPGRTAHGAGDRNDGPPPAALRDAGRGRDLHRAGGRGAGSASFACPRLPGSDSTSDAVAALKARLVADPRVPSVTSVTADQALAEASTRPGLDNLASLSSTNPFPASLDVQVRLVTQVGAVAASVKDDPAVDPSYPTSYDPATYSRLRQFALVVGGIGAGLVLLFGLIAYAVMANSMRGIATARRQEVGVIRLLGARGWMLRGPFVSRA